MNKNNFVNKTIVCSVIFLCDFGAQATSLPPDPNNAALFYYQALSLWSDVHSSYTDTDIAKEPNVDSDSRPIPDNTKLDIDKLLALERKIERKLGEKKRESRRRQQRDLTIKIVEEASRIPNCT